MDNQINNIKKKLKAVSTSVFVIKLLVLLTLVLYKVLGWQKVVLDINVLLDNAIISAYILLIASIMYDIGKFVITRVKFRSPRAKTVSTLVYSLFKYAVALVALVAILIEFMGQKYMTELITGLGVVALVIGFGCQALISDVVAGIFMVFEGNFQVGDIVVINGWRGTVNGIGLRTTVVEDVGGNIKIINNSSISEIVNNSQVLSFAACTVGIEYEESIERVEDVIADNLEDIKAEIPEIVEGPFYKGIDSLGDSAVNLIFIAQCREEDKVTVQRQLNRQLKLLFDKHSINIPYAQLTISNKADNSDRVIAEENVPHKKLQSTFDVDNID